MPADYPTIQSAINAAANGDTIQVAPGTYVENLNFLGKAIRLFSDQGSEVTVIDGNQAAPVVSFTSGEGPQSVLRGFTLRNGKAGVSPALRGGGIRIENSSPTITGNVITNNVAGDGGGGISSSFGSPLIQGNVITNNGQITGWSGGVGGGGVTIVGASTAQLLNNVISANSWPASGGGVTLFAAGTPTVQNNFITNNTAFSHGGGVWIVNYSDASIVQNIIVGNSASTGGGVYWLVPSGRRGPFLINNTISGNNSAQGSAVFAEGFDAQAQLTNNILASTNTQTAVVCGTFDAKSAPLTTASISPLPNSAGWNQTDTTVTLNATDRGSGVQSIHYSLSGAQSSSGVISGDQALVPITVEGSTVSYWAVDIAGNSENTKSIVINIDRTVPVISGMPAPNCTLSPPKHQLVQVANITASDALSGVATLTVTATSSEPDSGTGGGDLPEIS